MSAQTERGNLRGGRGTTKKHFLTHESTGPVDRMSHRKRRETNQQPSRARAGYPISCCLLSLHFLCDILSGGPVDVGEILKPGWAECLGRRAILFSFSACPVQEQEGRKEGIGLRGFNFRRLGSGRDRTALRASRRGRARGAARCQFF